MNRFIPTLFVNLKGTCGWQRDWFNKIDVSKVVSFDTRRRLFCIFDRDKPVELSIKYKVSGYDKYKTEKLYLRYKSKKQASLDIEKINKAQRKLEKYKKQQEAQFKKEMIIYMHDLNRKISEIKSTKMIKASKYPN